MIEGIVVERYTKRPLAGAVVNINGFSTYTNAKGFFKVKSPSGFITMKINHRDFNPKIESLNTEGVSVTRMGTILMDSIIRPL